MPILRRRMMYETLKNTILFGIPDKERSVREPKKAPKIPQRNVSEIDDIEINEDVEEPKQAKRKPKPKVPYSPSDFDTTKVKKKPLLSFDELAMQDPVLNPSLRGTSKKRGSHTAGRLRGRGRGRGKK